MARTDYYTCSLYYETSSGERDSRDTHYLSGIKNKRYYLTYPAKTYCEDIHAYVARGSEVFVDEQSLRATLEFQLNRNEVEVSISYYDQPITGCDSRTGAPPLMRSIFTTKDESFKQKYEINGNFVIFECKAEYIRE